MIRDAEIRALNVIIDYAEHGQQLPSQAEFARLLGFSPKSKGRVSGILANLEREGFIESDKTSTGRVKTHTIRLNKLQPVRPVPVLGRVAAGQPLLANGDDIQEFIRLPVQYLHHAGEVYMLEVRGDSMIGDGIYDGDHVIVAHKEWPKEGEIAVVLIGDEATIKHIKYEGDSIRLVASNPEFEDQVYDKNDQLNIQGKVIGVIRWRM